MRAGACWAVVLLLAACTGAPTPPTDPPATSPASATASPAPATASPVLIEPVRILATGLWDPLDGPFSVAGAANQADYEVLWARLDQPAPPPEVDFELELALYLGTSGSSSCPERFERLVVDEQQSVVFATWAGHDPGRPCTDDLQPQGVLLAVARSELPDQPFELRLQRQLVCVDCPRHADQVVVDPGA